ncbi:MAG: hypothetical protein Q8Q25_00150 [bacterium]|nr:hypothetical protein [bacterium]
MSQKKSVLFGTSRHFKDTSPSRNYSIVFSNGVIDLSHMTMPTQPTHVKIHTVFGQSTIILNKNIPTALVVNAVFADTELPYAYLQQTGSNAYQMGDEKPLLFIELDVVFGKTIVRGL